MGLGPGSASTRHPVHHIGRTNPLAQGWRSEPRRPAHSRFQVWMCVGVSGDLSRHLLFW